MATNTELDPKSILVFIMDMKTRKLYVQKFLLKHYFSLWNNLVRVDRDFKRLETDKRKPKDFNTTKRKSYTPFDIS